MKISILLTGLFMALAPATHADSNVVTIDQIANAERAATLATMSVINWKVGDSQDFKVSLGGFGMEGTMSKEATKEEGNAIWIKTDLNLPIAKDNSEMLIDRDSGKILKYIHNGKEEAVPTSDIEIISTNNESITVPAGTFKTMHVVAKSKDVKAIEIWINQITVSLGGAVKQYMDQGMMKITMELTKFVKH